MGTEGCTAGAKQERAASTPRTVLSFERSRGPMAHRPFGRLTQRGHVECDRRVRKYVDSDRLLLFCPRQGTRAGAARS
jgi:hypothetical protein